MDQTDTNNNEYTVVSFRIFNPDLDPINVSQELELTPEHMHNRGDFPKGNPRYAPYKHGMWILRSKLPGQKPLDEHLKDILSVLEPKKEIILKLAKSNTVDFYCSLFEQNGFNLSPEILAGISDIGAALRVSFSAFIEDDSDVVGQDETEK
jgi:hypothetical protein